jgi:hypothetical protein
MQAINTVNKINKVAGREVEVTVRGLRSFTFSFEDVDKEATRKICEFFKGHAKIEVQEDEECGTFIYCDI